jgi:hypothetical protein
MLATASEFAPNFPDLLRDLGVLLCRPSYLGAESMGEFFVHNPLDIVRRLRFAEPRQDRAHFRIIFVVGSPS